MIKLSIVIVNFRGWTRLKLCLDSLRCLNNASFTWEVIVVDNQSNDGQLEKYISNYPEFLFMENIGNYGFAHGCNYGANQSSGKFIFFLNPDTIVTLNAFDSLINVAEQNPALSILSCDQVNERGKDTKPYGFFLRPATLTGLLRSAYKLIHKHIPTQYFKSGENVLLPEWVSGSAIFISKRLFKEIGGWCEDYWMYYEDVDLCKRVHNKGGIIALVSKIKIIHNHGGSSRINISVKSITKTEVLISKHVYIHKHFSGFTRFLMQAYLMLNNILLGPLLMSIIGLPFYFIKSLRIYPLVYYKTIAYYFNVAINGTWISERSFNYKGKI